MDNAPKISVIVPVYKVEKYLRQCIDSILAQTFTDFELLLIDDGSPDSSGAICDEYASLDPRVRVFHKENEGVSSARNLGIDESKGELICFVDSDDWVEENYCQTIVDNIGDADMLVYTASDLYNDGTRLVRVMGEASLKFKDEIEEFIYRMMFNMTRFDFFAPPWNKAFRAEIVKEHNIQFVEGLFLFEDEVFCFDVLKYSKSINVIETPIYAHLAFTEGLSHKNCTMNNTKKLVQCYSDIIKSLANKKLCQSIMGERVSSLLKRLIMNEPNIFGRTRCLYKSHALCKELGFPFPYKELTIAYSKKTIKNSLRLLCYLPSNIKRMVKKRYRGGVIL